MTGLNWELSMFPIMIASCDILINTVFSRLPFIDDNDCGLGIAVRTYLDDLPLQADPTSPEARAEVKLKGKEWFQHSESFTGNLDLAFKLWDAVYKGTQNAGKEVKDAKLWTDANKWLSERR